MREEGAAAPAGRAGRSRRRWLLVLLVLLVGLPALAWAGARSLGLVPPAGVLAGTVLDRLSGREPVVLFPGGDGAAGTDAGAPGSAPGSAAGAAHFGGGGAAAVPGAGAGGAAVLDPQALLTGNPAGTAGKSAGQRAIEAAYIARLQAVAGGYQGRLNALVGAAWNEYLADRRQGKKVSVLALAGKYITAGNNLEAQCDAQFYAVLDQFEAALRANGYPPDTAVQARQAYEQAKAARRRELLSRALALASR